MAILREATDSTWWPPSGKLRGVWGAEPPSNRSILDELTLRQVERLAVLHIAGVDPPRRRATQSSGRHQTHLAIALGVEATRRRRRVVFVRAADLVRELYEARDDRALTRLHGRYQRVDLLVVDELGFVPFDKAGGELLFNLLSDRYEKCSTLVTTNLAFGEWVQVFGSEKLTTALLDRLGHHAHVLTTKGESFRTHRRGKH